MTDSQRGGRIPLGAPELPGTLNEVVARIRTSPRFAEVRIAVVTVIDAASGARVQTDQTSTAWVNRSEDVTLAVGDRVWLVKTGSAYIVAGRLSGEPSGPMIGTVTNWARATPPAGWFLCNGAVVSRSTYSTLFGVTGTAYGAGDGSTTFALPSISPLSASTGTVPYIIRAL